jgi:two-component system sensor histidine kinase KdpD
LNLLSNAIKYNRPGGKVELEASLAQNEIAIRVCDTGYGISPEDQEHLFEKFFRAPRTEHTETGTGLGLSITKSIIAAHHGRIEVASQAGEGSQFSIYLPLPG